MTHSIVKPRFLRSQICKNIGVAKNKIYQNIDANTGDQENFYKKIAKFEGFSGRHLQFLKE